MGKSGRIMTNNANGDNMIKFSSRKIASPAFTRLYAEGMDLVEETAGYLEGEGRQEARKLRRVASALYAAESMRLTTRLMQLASWLLLQRALKAGEMTCEQVKSEKNKIRLETTTSIEDIATWNELPDMFCSLVRRSLRLQARIRQMDIDIDAPLDEHDGYANPVLSQVNLLKTAFGSR